MEKNAIFNAANSHLTFKIGILNKNIRAAPFFSF